jgi:hypothetical protein
MLIGLPLLAHCGSSSSGSIIPPTKVPVFTASGTASAPDLVTLADGGTSPGSLIQVDVKLGGPTTATNLHAFSFNIVLSDPSLVRTVKAIQGDALTGDQAVLATLTGDKVVIGVTKLGATGNGVLAGGASILSLEFKMDPTKPGTTNLTFDYANAVVETPRSVCSTASTTTCNISADCPAGQTCVGERITSVNFDSASAKLTQPQ